MKAFHGEIELKQKYIDQIRGHMEADEIIKGKYWENGKGCSVGCILHSDAHSQYERLLGIPEWFAHVQDKIFEELPNKESKEFTLKLFTAINVGSNIDEIKIPFLIFIVESVLDKFDHAKFPEVKKSVDDVLHLLKTEPDNNEKLRKAARDARAAGDAAWAARAAGDAAWAARAAVDAADAACSAASAASTASAAWAAAWAAWAAWAARAVPAARAADWEASFIKFANELIRLVENCKYVPRVFMLHI